MSAWVERPWGHYRVLYHIGPVKVKELRVMPQKSLSMQRHFKRSEEWFIVTGSATVWTFFNDLTQHPDYNENILRGIYHKFDKLSIPLGQWHKLENQSTSEILTIVEIQYGDACEEEDIERR